MSDIAVSTNKSSFPTLPATVLKTEAATLSGRSVQLTSVNDPKVVMKKLTNQIGQKKFKTTKYLWSAKSIINIREFTQNTNFDSTLRKLLQLLLSLYKLSDEGGSQMSDGEETNALYQESQVKALVLSLSSFESSDPSFQKLLSILSTSIQKYQQAGSPKAREILYNSLKAAYQSVGNYVKGELESIIKKDFPNIDSFDSNHQTQFIAHVSKLYKDLLIKADVPIGHVVYPAAYDPNNIVNNGSFDSTSGWDLSGSCAISTNGGPFGLENSLHLDGNTQVSNANQTMTFSKPGTYIVAFYIKSSNINTAHIIINGEGFEYGQQEYVDWTDPGHEDYHLVYYAIKTDIPTTATLSISLGKGESNTMDISHLQVIYEGENTDLSKICQNILSEYPLPSLEGPAGLGTFPQLQHALNPGDNFLNWPPMYYPGMPEEKQYPYFAWDPNTAEWVNGYNGDPMMKLNPHDGMSSSVSSTSTGYLPGGLNKNYIVNCTVYVTTETKNASPIITVTAIDNTTTPPTKNTLFTTVVNPPLSSGIHYLSFSIPTKNIPVNHDFLASAEVLAYKGTGGFSVSDISITAKNSQTYTEANSVNPYAANRPMYTASEDWSKTYDFTSGNISNDWGIALVGNDIGNPQAQNIQIVKGEGIVLTDTYNIDGTYQDGGIQSTFMAAQGRTFDWSTTIQCKPPKTIQSEPSNPKNKPTLAFWTYGESQKGAGNPIAHKNPGASDMVTECDFEIGAGDEEHARCNTYAGWDKGGKDHQTYTAKMPYNVYDGGKYTIFMKIVPLGPDNTECTVQWLITQLAPPSGQKPGPNTKKPQLVHEYTAEKGGKGWPLGDNGTYLKIMTERPKWGITNNQPGTTHFVISSITYSEGPPQEGAPPLSDSDYSYNTPSKGFNYTPFQN